MHDEFLDIVEHPPALADRSHDAVELIVCEHNPRCTFRDVGARETHSYSYVCRGEGGCVVYAVAGHGHVEAATAEGEDHASLGFGCAAGKYEGKGREGINLGVAERVEVGCFLDD